MKITKKKIQKSKSNPISKRVNIHDKLIELEKRLEKVEKALEVEQHA